MASSVYIVVEIRKIDSLFCRLLGRLNAVETRLSLALCSILVTLLNIERLELIALQPYVERMTIDRLKAIAIQSLCQ